WSPFDWQTYPNVAAYVALYSPARQSVPAACAVLFGAIPANGRLAVTLSLELEAGARAQQITLAGLPSSSSCPTKGGERGFRTLSPHPSNHRPNRVLFPGPVRVTFITTSIYI